MFFMSGSIRSARKGRFFWVFDIWHLPSWRKGNGIFKILIKTEPFDQEKGGSRDLFFSDETDGQRNKKYSYSLKLLAIP